MFRTRKWMTRKLLQAAKAEAFKLMVVGSRPTGPIKNQQLTVTVGSGDSWGHTGGTRRHEEGGAGLPSASHWRHLTSVNTHVIWLELRVSVWPPPAIACTPL